MIYLNIIFNILFITLVYQDIKTKILSDTVLFSMFFVSIIKAFLIMDFKSLYFSMAIYTLPIYFLIIAESYIKKEIIGLGDIKLILIISGFLSNPNLIKLNLFYTISLSLALVYAYLLKKDEKYIAFVPMLYLAFLVIMYGK